MGLKFTFLEIKHKLPVTRDDQDVQGNPANIYAPVLRGHFFWTSFRRSSLALTQLTRKQIHRFALFLKIS